MSEFHKIHDFSLKHYKLLGEVEVWYKNYQAQNVIILPKYDTACTKLLYHTNAEFNIVFIIPLSPHNISNQIKIIGF